MVTGPWHHVPDARGTLEFNREMAKCQVVSAQTPVDSSTPAVVEIVRWRVLINCLKASGYEPGAKGPAVARQSASAKTKLSDLQGAGGGIGIYPCSEFTKALEKPDLEAVFFTWTQGFLTGWNMGAPDDSGFSVDMSGLTRDEQKEFMRDYFFQESGLCVAKLAFWEDDCCVPGVKCFPFFRSAGFYQGDNLRQR